MNRILKFIKSVLKKVKMGIVSKMGTASANKPEVKSQVRLDEIVLTEQELEFILIKLRESSYKGHEFDTYARIYKKLVDQLKN
jgi:hypothetical protein